MNAIGTVKRIFLDLIFPKQCEWCGDPFADGLSNVICRRCFDSILPYKDPVCDGCGVSLAEGSFEDALLQRCRECGDSPGFLDRVRALGPYEGPLRITHHAFKFEGMQNLKKEMVFKVMAAIPDHFWRDVQALVPVPLSPERERERGYNPAILLSDEVSKKISIPVQNLLEKVRSTPPQMSLNREQRIHNPRGAYRMVQWKGMPVKVVLIDDVLTTGSTLEECAKVLKQAGVQWVGAVVWGRTPRY
jgi:competence protein ComFC